MDTLIYDTIIVTLDERDSWYNPGYVFIKGNKIREVNSGQPPKELFSQAKKVIKATDKLVMPGLINSHTHAAMSLFRGLADDLPLDKWLNTYIFPVEKAFVNEEFTYWGTLLAGWEMITSGTACFADGYFCEDAAVKACLDLGIRGILAQGIIDFPAPGVSDFKKNIFYAEQFLKKWQGVSELITPAIFAHAPYTCSDKTLKFAKRLANDYQIFFFIHVAETKWEVEEIKKIHGFTPVAYLYHLGILDPNTVLVHANWLTEEEMAIIRDTEVKVVHCPESNLKLASGLSPVPELLDKNILVALGTDGCASNNNLDLFQEMNTCAKIHKGLSLDPTIMPTQTVLKMSTVSPAQMFSLNIGVLKKGNFADLIIINFKQPHLFPFYNPYSHLVYAVHGTDVETVIINGKIIMEDKRLLSINSQKIKTNIYNLANKIKLHLSPNH
ncbi:MAG TPA: amidohydrolase [Candidatus Desulfofervidus auxilii]|uniref:5-methylthioadenosine/S-adenosylhomocysteine deaminase n=1 Tax=Desulfofervidus auxilii TaxID=1621989 RepID=A0A7C1W4J6_DESA2|nr:amidohydrolase [Candidatus Desulfofervidus auxilii]